MHKSRKLKGYSVPGSGERILKSRILIVEDEREIGELIGLYLRKEGFETSLAQSAEEPLSFRLLCIIALLFFWLKPAPRGSYGS